MSGHLNGLPEHTRGLVAEIERLRAEINSFCADYRMKCDERMKALDVEVERMRAEIKAIRADFWRYTGSEWSLGKSWENPAYQTAIDALRALDPTCHVAECLIELHRLQAREKRRLPRCPDCGAELIEREVERDGVAAGVDLRCPSC